MTGAAATGKCRRAERDRRCAALITDLKAETGERRRVGGKESSKQTEVRQVWKHPTESSARLQKEMEEGLFGTQRGEEEEEKRAKGD